MGQNIAGLNTDNFGTSISLSTTGNRLAVSSLRYVRVFDFDEGKWIKIGSDIDLEKFRKVALSGEGDTLAVSMQYDSDNVYHVGKVQVFSLSKEQEEWTKVGNNDIMTGSNNSDYLGDLALAISTDGTTVAAGSHNGDYVKVFRLVGGGWSLLGGVINGVKREGFGRSVDLSRDGGRVVIGASTNSYEGKDDRGRAVVYDFINDNWVTVGEPFYGENSNDNFGNSVSISDSGKRLTVGAYGNDANGNEDAGHVKVFQYNDKEDSSKGWILIEKAIDGESKGDLSGTSVALSNDANFVAIGAPAWYGNYILR